MMLSTRELDRFHAGMAREAAKPKTIRDLERQLQRIHTRQTIEVFRNLADREAEELRHKIRALGEKPVA
jgi:hypothetical protein